MPDFRDFHRAGQELLLWGWGRLNKVEVDLERLVARFQLTNSIFVGGNTGRTPVCHYMRGFEAGAFEVAFGRRSESIELLREGKGDTNCELVTGKASRISRLADSIGLEKTSRHISPGFVNRSLALSGRNRTGPRKRL